MKGIPNDVGGAIDNSLCDYDGYFPNITCVLCTCNKCGTDKYKEYLMVLNATKMSDKSRRFLIKQWVTKTVKKEGTTQSFLTWKFERCNYEQLVDLLMDHMNHMAEHTFMASWNYVQYKQARKNILIGDVIMVHEFAQNYLCKHQKEVQGLHWRHKQVTVMPTLYAYTVVHYRCVKCHQLTTHQIVHVSEDFKHDAHLVKAFTARTLSVLRQNKVEIHKIIKFTDQAPSQHKNKTAFNHLCSHNICIQKNHFGVRHGKSS